LKRAGEVSRFSKCVCAALPPDLCAPFRARLNDVLASKVPVSDAYAGPDFYKSDSCLVAKGGVWATEARDVVESKVPPTNAYEKEQDRFQGRWFVVHVDVRGTRAERAAAPLEIGPHHGGHCVVTNPYDYDGDGTDEVLVTCSEGSFDDDTSKGSLWASRGESLGPYAKASAVGPGAPV
jgi:hypothetical protein